MYGSSSWQLPIFKSATATMWRLERVRRVCCLLSIGVHTQSTHQSKTNLRNKMFDSSALNASFRSAVQCVCTLHTSAPKPHTAPVPKSSQFFFASFCLSLYFFFAIDRIYLFFRGTNFVYGKILNGERKKKKTVQSFGILMTMRTGKSGKTCGKNAQYNARSARAVFTRQSSASPISRLLSFRTAFDNAITGIISGPFFCAYHFGAEPLMYRQVLYRHFLFSFRGRFPFI